MDLNDSTLNAEAIREHLDERSRSGRSAGEAAGEILFIRDHQVRSGTLSKQSRNEYGEIVDQWISDTSDEESVTVQRGIADLYARFLADTVDWTFPNDVPAQIDTAWREWRAQAK